jgi:hypothetical protein
VKITVNAAMVLQKALRGRLAELSSLRSTCATTETYFGTPQRVVEPKYDVKALDKRCVELENVLLDIDTAIKGSNAIVTIDIAADKNALLAPLT